MKVLLVLASLAVGWFGHDWYKEHGKALPSVTLTVTPPKASNSGTPQKSAEKRKTQENTKTARENG
jgi:hypothetical protein